MRAVLLVLFLMSCSVGSFAQQDVVSKVEIKLIYKDSEGQKHVENKELIGQEADDFDAEAYEEQLAERDIEILNLDISQSVTKSKSTEIPHKLKEKQKGTSKKMKTVKIKKIITKGADGSTTEIIEEIESGEGDIFEVEEKGGKFYVNGEEVEGKKKQIRIMKSNDHDNEVKVEVKDGKVFINGEEVEEGAEDGNNIWISDDHEIHDLHDGEHNMIFVTDDMDKPRMGVMIEDGKAVNGAEIVETVPDSPAAKAGLQDGDVVTAIDDNKVYGASSMIEALSNFNTGDTVKVTYDRSGMELTANVKLEQMAAGTSKTIKKKIIIKTEEDKQ